MIALEQNFAEFDGPAKQIMSTSDLCIEIPHSISAQINFKRWFHAENGWLVVDDDQVEICTGDVGPNCGTDRDHCHDVRVSRGKIEKPSDPIARPFRGPAKDSRRLAISVARSVVRHRQDPST